MDNEEDLYVVTVTPSEILNDLVDLKRLVHKDDVPPTD